MASGKVTREVTINGEYLVKLPNSDYWVTCEGTLFKVTRLVTYNDKPGYRVTRKGTQRYYSKEQLAKLYARYSKK